MEPSFRISKISVNLMSSFSYSGSHTSSFCVFAIKKNSIHQMLLTRCSYKKFCWGTRDRFFSTTVFYDNFLAKHHSITSKITVLPSVFALRAQVSLFWCATVPFGCFFYRTQFPFAVCHASMIEIWTLHNYDYALSEGHEIQIFALIITT